MNAPQATSGVPLTSPSTLQIPTGPIPAPSSAPDVIIPQPTGNNSAPPPILSTTPPTKKEGTSFQDLIITIFYLIFTGYAIYYGWVFGQQKGRDYLLYVQSIGAWLRSWFVRPAPLSV